MKILVVEDEEKTGIYLRKGLSEAGFIVDLVNDGFDGLDMALSESYVLIVLDIMLPGIDGWQILQGIRRAGKETQVLFLTALDPVEDRVKGLELGADDYLVKPFAFSELLARIRTLLRRTAKVNEVKQLHVADLELDLLRRRVTRAGIRIDLTTKEFALLELLMRCRGEVLPRSLIAAQVWGINFDRDTNIIEVAIKRLRQKVDQGFEPKLMTQTQVTLTRSRSVNEYRDVLGSNIEEFERLSRMIADMLFLAKADNQQIIPHEEQVDLASEVADLLEFYAVLAEEKSVKLTCHGTSTVTGDRLMLRRAISNLLSNALRHTPVQGRVRVDIALGNMGYVHLTVANTGTAIPAEHLPKLFERFYRIDGSRHRTSEGAGLGLAITRSIASAHGGTVEVSSSPSGNLFSLKLPSGL